LPGSVTTAAAVIWRIVVGVTADPFAGSVAEGEVVAVTVVAVIAVVVSVTASSPMVESTTSTSSLATVVSGLDESELEPPHDATATRAIAKMAHLVTRDLI
jgi:hypothetical protein